MTGAYTYTFGCPFCGASWSLEQFVLAAADIFRVGDWSGQGECPSCGRQFVWRTHGVLNDKSARLDWHKSLRKHYPKRCAVCERAIFGRRKKYCSVDCKNAAYYQRNKEKVLKQQKQYRKTRTHTTRAA